MGRRYNITAVSKYNQELDNLNEQIAGTSVALGVFAIGLALTLSISDVSLKLATSIIPGAPGFFALKELINLVSKKRRIKNNPDVYKTLMSEPFKGLRR